MESQADERHHVDANNSHSFGDIDPTRRTDLDSDDKHPTESTSSDPGLISAALFPIQHDHQLQATPPGTLELTSSDLASGPFSYAGQISLPFSSPTFQPLNRNLSIIFEQSESRNSILENIPSNDDTPNQHHPPATVEKYDEVPLIGNNQQSAIFKGDECISHKRGDRDRVPKPSRIPVSSPLSLGSRRHSLPSSWTNGEVNRERQIPISLDRKNPSSLKSEERLHTGLLWFLNVHSQQPFRWIQCKASLYRSHLQLSWHIPGTGKANVTLDLLNCIEARSMATLTRESESEDVGAVAFKMGSKQILGKLDSLFPVHLFYNDGVERLATETIRDRFIWINALWDLLTSNPNHLVTKSPGEKENPVLGIVSTLAYFPQSKLALLKRGSKLVEDEKASQGNDDGRQTHSGASDYHSVSSEGTFFTALPQLEHISSKGLPFASSNGDEKYVKVAPRSKLRKLKPLNFDEKKSGHRRSFSDSSIQAFLSRGLSTIRSPSIASSNSTVYITAKTRTSTGQFKQETDSDASTAGFETANSFLSRKTTTANNNQKSRNSEINITVNPKSERPSPGIQQSPDINHQSVIVPTQRPAVRSRLPKAESTLNNKLFEGIGPRKNDYASEVPNPAAVATFRSPPQPKAPPPSSTYCVSVPPPSPVTQYPGNSRSSTSPPLNFRQFDDAGEIGNDESPIITPRLSGNMNIETGAQFGDSNEGEAYSETQNSEGANYLRNIRLRAPSAESFTSSLLLPSDSSTPDGSFLSLISNPALEEGVAATTPEAVINLETISEDDQCVKALDKVLNFVAITRVAQSDAVGTFSAQMTRIEEELLILGGFLRDRLMSKPKLSPGDEETRSTSQVKKHRRPTGDMVESSEQQLTPGILISSIDYLESPGANATHLPSLRDVLQNQPLITAYSSMGETNVTNFELKRMIDSLKILLGVIIDKQEGANDALEKLRSKEFSIPASQSNGRIGDFLPMDSKHSSRVQTLISSSEDPARSSVDMTGVEIRVAELIKLEPGRTHIRIPELSVPGHSRPPESLGATGEHAPSSIASFQHSWVASPSKIDAKIGDIMQDSEAVLADPGKHEDINTLTADDSEPITRTWYRKKSKVSWATPLVPENFNQGQKEDSTLPPAIEDELLQLALNSNNHQRFVMDQQQEVVRYLQGLNDWLSRDSYDRRAELHSIGFRLEQLHSILFDGKTGRIPLPSPNWTALDPSLQQEDYFPLYAFSRRNPVESIDYRADHNTDTEPSTIIPDLPLPTLTTLPVVKGRHDEDIAKSKENSTDWRFGEDRVASNPVGVASNDPVVVRIESTNNANNPEVRIPLSENTVTNAPKSTNGNTANPSSKRINPPKIPQNTFERNLDDRKSRKHSLKRPFSDITLDLPYGEKETSRPSRYEASSSLTGGGLGKIPEKGTRVYTETHTETPHGNHYAGNSFLEDPSLSRGRKRSRRFIEGSRESSPQKLIVSPSPTTQSSDGVIQPSSHSHGTGPFLIHKAAYDTHLGGGRLSIRHAPSEAAGFFQDALPQHDSVALQRPSNHAYVTHMDSDESLDSNRTNILIPNLTDETTVIPEVRDMGKVLGPIFQDSLVSPRNNPSITGNRSASQAPPEIRRPLPVVMVTDTPVNSIRGNHPAIPSIDRFRVNGNQDRRNGQEFLQSERGNKSRDFGVTNASSTLLRVPIVTAIHTRDPSPLHEPQYPIPDIVTPNAHNDNRMDESVHLKNTGIERPSPKMTQKHTVIVEGDVSHPERSPSSHSVIGARLINSVDPEKINIVSNPAPEKQISELLSELRESLRCGEVQRNEIIESLKQSNEYGAEIEKERAKARELENEIGKARAELEELRAQRALKERETMSDHCQQQIESLHKGISEQLGDITNRMNVCRNDALVQRQSDAEKWDEKTKNRANKAERHRDIISLVHQLSAQQAEQHLQAENERRLQASQPGYASVIDELRRQGAAQQLLLHQFMNQTLSDGRKNQMETLEIMKTYSLQQVQFNVHSYLQQFSGALADEVRVLLHEVGGLREHRRSLQYEIGCLLCLRSKYEPGGEFDPNWSPYNPTCPHTFPQKHVPTQPSPFSGNTGPPPKDAPPKLPPKATSEPVIFPMQGPSPKPTNPGEPQVIPIAAAATVITGLKGDPKATSQPHGLFGPRKHNRKSGP